MNDKLARILSVALPALYLIPALGPMFSSEKRDFHDFTVYYQAAKNWLAGGDPYEPITTTLVDGSQMVLPYVYPPTALPFFGMFASLEYDTACMLFLLIKLAMLAGLLVIWTRVFLQKPHPLFFVFCVLAFNSPLYADLAVGNVAIFEQFLLWLGLTCYLQRKVPAFCIAVTAAAFFKFTPILFLLLLLAPGYRTAKNLKWAGGSAGVFALILLISWLSASEMWSAFFANAKTVNFLGVFNPSSYTFWEFLRIRLGDVYQVTMPESLVWLLYLATVATVLTLTWRAIRKLGSDPDPRFLITLFCFAYALVLPRFPDYAYALLLAPAWYILSRTKVAAMPILVLLCCLQALAGNPMPGIPFTSSLVFNNFPLLLAFLVWALGLRLAAQGPESEAAPAKASTA